MFASWQESYDKPRQCFEKQRHYSAGERKKESYDKPRQCVEKQRHYSADKGPYIQGYGLPTGHIWLLEQDIKKAEHQRIDAFNLWFWRRLLRVSWTAWRLN